MQLLQYLRNWPCSYLNSVFLMSFIPKILQLITDVINNMKQLTADNEMTTTDM